MSDEELALVPVLVNDELVYVNRFGELWRWTRHRWNAPKFRKIDTKLHPKGYINPRIGEKCVRVHRIVASAFLGLNMSDTKTQVDHINGIRHDNRLENLRLVTNQQNAFNTKALGYSWNKQKNKWQSEICIDGRNIYLGSFVNSEDARQAYLDAKLVHHQIP